MGKEKDSESDLGDFGVRKYEAETGRFLSTDPLWEKYRKLTPYHYCGNNPLIFRDPSGLGEEEVNNAAQKVQETVTQIETLAEQNKEN
ncbi:MAG: hypothetical protein J0M05_04160 [Candidatus Kapabacteria bacterium]|nr:hypothetical protein [Candidatus Kapabacteria bacterium]